MSGYFSGGTYRVSYTDAVRVDIRYYKSGDEKSRETVYSGGAGRMQFGDDGSLVWYNPMESLAGSDTFRKTG